MGTSSLSRFAHLSREPDSDQAWDMCRQAWKNTGLVCLHPDQVEKRLGWAAAQEVRNMGELAFGKRRKGTETD